MLFYPTLSVSSPSTSIQQRGEVDFSLGILPRQCRSRIQGHPVVHQPRPLSSVATLRWRCKGITTALTAGYRRALLHYCMGVRARVHLDCNEASRQKICYVRYKG